MASSESGSGVEVVSQRGKAKRTHEGHLYVQDKKSKDGFKQFWKCHHVGSCKARLHTWVSTGEVVGVLGVHSDEANPAAIEIAGRRQVLKRRAVETQEPPLQLIEDAFETSTQAARLLLPSSESLARSVIRARNTASRPPSIPLSAATIVIPQEYSSYKSEPGSSERFLIGDSGEFWDLVRFELSIDLEMSSIPKILCQIQCYKNDFCFLPRKVSAIPKGFYCSGGSPSAIGSG